jgi:hypothetical protein
VQDGFIWKPQQKYLTGETNVLYNIREFLIQFFPFIPCVESITANTIEVDIVRILQ